MLYNLAELQNDCSSLFKISPSDTLKIVQELYEKKLVTYPRTDARVLSTAVAKEIYKNIDGLEKSKVEISTLSRYTEKYFPFVMAALALLLLEVLLRYLVFRKFP